MQHISFGPKGIGSRLGYMAKGRDSGIAFALRLFRSAYALFVV